MDSIPIEAGGATLGFRTLTGAVIGTDQRSDSYTTGSSRTVVVDGQGGGSGHVSTMVVVNRDIWVRDAGGAEHHVRIAVDVPVRVGQDICIVLVEARKRSENRTVAGVATICVPSLNRQWTVMPLDGISASLVKFDPSQAAAFGYIALWGISLLACLILIGIPVMLFLIVRSFMGTARRKREGAEILSALKAEHERTLHLALDVWKEQQLRLAPASAAPMPAIGTAP